MTRAVVLRAGLLGSAFLGSLAGQMNVGSAATAQLNGASATFSLQSAASSGATVSSMGVLFSWSETAVDHACYLQYVNSGIAGGAPSPADVWLLNDSADSWTAATLQGDGISYRASNSQCTVQLYGNAVAGVGGGSSTTSVRFTFTVTMAPAMQKPQYIYQTVTDSANLTTGPQLMSEWAAMDSPGFTGLADSVQDFSATQHQKGWEYGYFAGGDPGQFKNDLIFDATNSMWHHDGAFWPPWTAIWSNGGHPNGADSPRGVEYSVRRWTYTGATVSAD